MKTELVRHPPARPPLPNVVLPWPSLLLGLALVAGCQSGPDSGPRAPTLPTAAASAVPADWLEWQAKRRESLAGSNGWTTLVARHWLTEGRTTAGAHRTNQLVLPAERAPAHVGVFQRTRRQVRFEAAPGITATIDGQPIRSATLASDLSNAPTRVVIGPLTMTVIERGDRIGIRVRDPASPARQQFKGIDCFPYDPAWRLPGRYVPYKTPRTLRVDDILGGQQNLTSPGSIEFNHAGQSHRLEVVEEAGETDYFVIFHDRTAGDSTYPSGRFLYIERPGADGRVWIDFNRSYTPPCGYTEFAVCPLPPPQNWLPFPIHAGERKPLNAMPHGSPK